ncbi:MAG: acetolactate synthase [Oscillospiraceae bacterium]|nr:acetolactate synthase [Oscillospiraceae bacterium]MDD7293461.1 acetolactate synthase [Clostridiaceae bacterium]MDY5992186.1 acetolactate synthase [Oscillospiraceae bacterium]
MLIKQISVFVENKEGRLAEITETIAKAGVDIRALSIADTTDFGILRLIVDKPHETEKVLRDSGFTVSVTSVIAVGIDDVPGGFAKPMRVLANAHIDVEYMYAFISRDTKKAYVILRVNDNATATKVLEEAGIVLLDENGFHDMMK